MGPRIHLQVFDGYEVWGLDECTEESQEALSRALQEAEDDSLELVYIDREYQPHVAYVSFDSLHYGSERGGSTWIATTKPVGGEDELHTRIERLVVAHCPDATLVSTAERVSCAYHG